jgi:hypothetical protein
MQAFNASGEVQARLRPFLGLRRGIASRTGGRG